MNEAQASDYEPSAWLLIFHRECRTPWVNRLVPGRFKHVSAVGWCALADCWVIYDPTLQRTQILVLPDKLGPLAYARMAVGNSVLQMPVLEQRASGRLGFWCVPAIKHLVGLRSGALRPVTLWRDCLANGAKVISDGCDNGRVKSNPAIDDVHADA